MQADQAITTPRAWPSPEQMSRPFAMRPITAAWLSAWGENHRANDNAAAGRFMVVGASLAPAAEVAS